jgi:hypothetical protein
VRVQGEEEEEDGEEAPGVHGRAAGQCRGGGEWQG